MTNYSHFPRLCLIALLAIAFLAEYAPAEEPLRVCLLSGCPTYNSEKSLGDFQPYLEKNFPIVCSRATRVADNDLPGLENLETCDVALVFFKRMKLEGEQLAQFQKYVTSGRPIVAVRTASHAVQTWLEFDKTILGGNYDGHYDKTETEIKLADGGTGHPILAGVTLSAAPGPLYKNSSHADDITVLLTGSIPGHTEPLAWTREHQGGRIFYTSLGNPETFEDEQFRRMLVNALYWTARRDPPR